MGNYYYLVAQLPLLTFGLEPGMTAVSFLEEAGKWMTSADWTKLQNSRLAEESGTHPASRLTLAYRDFESRFTDDLAEWRKARRSGREHRPSFPPALVREGNPLEVEKKLLHHRWVYIEELSVGHHFDIDFLSGYYLQLQIWDKLSRFNKEKGMGTFRQLCGKTE
jgi:hypothetical protein